MLSYTITGSLDKPPLVFLHGFLGIKEDWEQVIAHLKDQFCCYAFDLPGHGKSEIDLHLNESVIATILSLKLPPCPLVGYSMGGRIALSLKDQFPQSFKELVILGSHTGITDPAERQLRWQQDQNWSEMLETLPFDDFLKAWYAQPVFYSLSKKPNLLENILERRMKQDPKNMATILRNFSVALQPPIKNLHSETLFLYGEDDLKSSVLYHQLPKHVKVEKITNSGHVLHLENPQEVAEKIKEFLQ